MESRGVGRVKARWDPAASNRAPHRPSLRGVHLHPRRLSASAAQREEPGEVPWGLQDRAAPAAPVDPGGGGFCWRPRADPQRYGCPQPGAARTREGCCWCSESGRSDARLG